MLEFVDIVQFVKAFLNRISLIRKTSLKLAVVGGSNSVMRTGYFNYLAAYINQATSRPTILNYYALGGSTSIYGVIQQDRRDIAANSDVVFFEFCINDRYAIDEKQYSLELAGQALEGFIRKVKKSNPTSLIVILIFRHLENCYDDSCYLSELYESVGRHYNLPVIDLTKSLNETQGLDYVTSLYDERDPAHFRRPQGVQFVAQAIVEELDRLGIIDAWRSGKKQYQAIDTPPIYSGNFESLAFFNRFNQGSFFVKRPRVYTFISTVIREKCFSIHEGNSLNFLLKGKLMAILIKSDENDGFVDIKFGNQRIVTSSYSAWVNKIKPRNVVNLITLPLLRFSESSDFAPLSISTCSEYPQDFELEVFKVVPPQLEPRNWKLSIMGIVYSGELKPLNSV